MPFLPSLLEYDITVMEQKLELLSKHEKQILTIQQTETISLHLDFVGPEFAVSRNVAVSLQPEEVFALLNKYFDQYSLNLSIHFMATDGDMEDILDYLIPTFSDLAFEQDWGGKVFVTKSQAEMLDFLPEISNFELGEWLDLGQWADLKPEPKQNYLLMTVLAGKSGQKMTPQDKQFTLNLAKNNPNSHITLDGGWDLENELYDNLDIVSYSSFWKKVDEVLNAVR
jgi:hypothetical protein